MQAKPDAPDVESIQAQSQFQSKCPAPEPGVRDAETRKQKRGKALMRNGIDVKEREKCNEGQNFEHELNGRSVIESPFKTEEPITKRKLPTKATMP